MASPTRAGATPGTPPQRPRWQLPFLIETNIEVTQDEEACEIRRLSAGGTEGVEIVSTAPCGPIRISLPELFPGFTEQILGLLRTPDVVKLSVLTHIPPERAVPTAAVHVELLRDDKLFDPSTQDTLRKLFAGSSSASWSCKRKRERERREREREREERERRERERRERGLSLPVEVVQMVGCLFQVVHYQPCLRRRYVVLLRSSIALRSIRHG